MEERGDYVKKDEPNQKLSPNILTLADLNVYLNLHFVNNREAGSKANISEGRVKQIRIGYCLPKSAKLINQIADAWNIDRTKLALLFERERKVEL